MSAGERVRGWQLGSLSENPPQRGTAERAAREGCTGGRWAEAPTCSREQLGVSGGRRGLCAGTAGTGTAGLASLKDSHHDGVETVSEARAQRQKSGLFW